MNKDYSVRRHKKGTRSSYLLISYKTFKEQHCWVLETVQVMKINPPQISACLKNWKLKIRDIFADTCRFSVSVKITPSTIWPSLVHLGQRSFWICQTLSHVHAHVIFFDNDCRHFTYTCAKPFFVIENSLLFRVYDNLETRGNRK